VSLILDALKKAERQHRLGEVPGIGGAMTDEPVRSRWPGLLLLSLLAIAMLILGLYLGGTSTPEITSVPEQTDLSLPLPDSMLPEPLKADPVKPPPVAEIETPEQTNSLVPVVEEPVVTPPTVDMPVPEKTTRSTQAPAAPKQQSELPDGFVENLPTLNIDIHSFDEQSHLSYVLINMKKYREGEYLKEGPLLSEIVREGVVLEHMGERFILPIGNN
jgi:hypothetical protein